MARHKKFDLWTQVRAAYQQLERAVENGAEAPSRLTGHLAFRLSRTFAQFDRDEQRFILELLECFSGTDLHSAGQQDKIPTIFQDHYGNKQFNKVRPYKVRDPDGRLVRPVPFEAAVETVRRLVLVNSLREAARDAELGAILGGSVSYGRFYNTKGRSVDPSDLDLVVVMQDFPTGIQNLASSLSEVRGVGQEAVEQLAARADDGDATEDTCSISHQFTVWDAVDYEDPLMLGAPVGADFKVQLHMFDEAGFRHMIGDDYPTFIDPSIKRIWITDVRNDRPKRGKKSTDRCFAAIEKSFNRAVRRAGDRYLVQESCFSVMNERFYPGLFHGLLIPQFEVRWDDTTLNLRLAMTRYKNKLLDRLQYERVLRPWEDQTILYSHLRHSNFNPHVTRKILNSSGDLY